MKLMVSFSHFLSSQTEFDLEGALKAFNLEAWNTRADNWPCHSLHIEESVNTCFFQPNTLNVNKQSDRTQWPHLTERQRVWSNTDLWWRMVWSTSRRQSTTKTSVSWDAAASDTTFIHAKITAEANLHVHSKYIVHYIKNNAPRTNPGKKSVWWQYCHLVGEFNMTVCRRGVDWISIRWLSPLICPDGWWRKYISKWFYWCQKVFPHYSFAGFNEYFYFWYLICVLFHLLFVFLCF